MNFYRDITFAAPSATLTNFPVLVRIQNDRMKNRISSSQGYDIGFQQNGTDLPFELDFYDSSTGSGAWWVQIPSLPTGSPTTIRMLYGDSSITTNQSSPTTVWSGFIVVCHFNEADASQQFNSASGTYGTWSETSNQNKSVSLISGGVTGQALYVNSLFHWNTPSVLTFSCASMDCDNLNFVTIGKFNGCFETGATLIETAQAKLAILARLVYGGSYSRQTPYTSGTLEYMNTSWRSSDQAVYWQVNDSFESGSMNCTWGPTDTSVKCLFAYNSASSGKTYTYEIDELRIRKQFVSQAESTYENNLLMHYANYVTYGPEYHSDGTLVVDFQPWILQQTILE